MAVHLLLIFIIVPIFLYMCYCKSKESHTHHSACVSLFTTHNLPNIFSLIRLNLIGDEGRRLAFTSRMLAASPSSTVILHVPFGGGDFLFTADPDNVRHVLKTQFSNYQMDHTNVSAFKEVVGRGLLNVQGDEWRSQRQFMSHTLSKGFVRSAVESVLDPCIANSLIKTLSIASKKAHVVNLHDVLQRFSFDTACKMAFGYEPGCHLFDEKVFQAYKQAVMMSNQRVKMVFPSSVFWKIERLLNIGSQKRLMEAVDKIRGFTLAIVEQRREKLKLGFMGSNDDFLSRVLQNYRNDDSMILDVMVNFILAGYGTVPSALTWFFWNLSTNPEVEDEILREIRRVEKYDNPIDQVKSMVYTHAALCESMRLYPPIPEDSKEAANDDILPDGTHVKKGTKIVYSIHTMGRSERIWGLDSAEYKPKRWLKWDDTSETWTFIPRDPYTYTVFHAGPRMCLGIDLALSQMKILVARFLSKFKVIPCKNEEPAFNCEIIGKMNGGFPVRLEERNCI